MQLISCKKPRPELNKKAKPDLAFAVLGRCVRTRNESNKWGRSAIVKPGRALAITFRFSAPSLTCCPGHRILEDLNAYTKKTGLLKHMHIFVNNQVRKMLAGSATANAVVRTCASFLGDEIKRRDVGQGCLFRYFPWFSWASRIGTPFFIIFILRKIENKLRPFSVILYCSNKPTRMPMLLCTECCSSLLVSFLLKKHG